MREVGGHRLNRHLAETEGRTREGPQLPLSQGALTSLGAYSWTHPLRNSQSRTHSDLPC